MAWQNIYFVKFMLIILIGLKDLANSLYFMANYKNYCTQKGYKTEFPILKNTLLNKRISRKKTGNN